LVVLKLPFFAPYGGLEPSGSEWGAVVGSFEHANEEIWGIFEQLSKY
jgi:hypothetical protein